MRELKPNKKYACHIILMLIALGMSSSNLAAQTYDANLPDFTTVVDEAGESVVNIVTIKHGGKKLIPDHLRDDIEDTPLMDVLKEMFGSQLDQKLSGKTPGLGSGSIISKDGYIITNYHVVQSADDIFVRLHDRREFKAKLIGKDVGTDLALLKIEAENLKPLKYAKTNSIKVGQWVLAIGSPYGFENTVTVGVVSATDRSLGSERYVPFLQSDVAINPGNSGGALLNLKGEMVGINSQIISESGSYAGLSFAVPSQVVQSVVKQLQEKGSVSRGWIGMAFQDVTRDLALSFGLSKVKGALISNVVSGSPAEQAGLKLGDVIVAFNGKDIVKATDLPPLVGLVPIDTSVPMQVVRNNQNVDLSLRIGTFNKNPIQKLKFKAQAVVSDINKMAVKQGVIVRNLEDYEQNSLKQNQQGVKVVKLTNYDWLDSGLRRGDVILSVNRKPVRNITEFYAVVSNVDKSAISLLVTRQGGTQRFIAVKLGR
tara:strand:- start:83679 stop:85130 length:1452 start_codon:yes stop_codon:yes gene_type:complete